MVIFSKKCEICNTKTKDNYWVDSKKRHLCRTHLIQEFKKDFISSDKKILVFYPDLEERGSNYFYRLTTLSDANKFYSFKDPQYGMIEFIKENLNKINGKCILCNQEEASVAYFSKKDYQWNSSNGIDFIDIKNIKNNPEIVCKKCIADRIVRSIERYRKNFIEPITFLTNQEGLLITDGV